jgi:hypothetical protein
VLLFQSIASLIVSIQTKNSSLKKKEIENSRLGAERGERSFGEGNVEW